MGARADVKTNLPPPHGQVLLDAPSTHPRGSSVIAAAVPRQGDATKRDQRKYRGNAAHLHLGSTFVPASVESYGYLGRHLTYYLKPECGRGIWWSRRGFWLPLSQRS